MTGNLFSSLQILLLVLALSTDAFLTSLAYGTNKISIPWLSVAIINVICSASLTLSVLIGTLISPFFPERLSRLLCMIILMFLGFMKIFNSVIKAYIRKHSPLNKEFKLSMFNVQFILSVYADPQKADADYSRVLSPFESVALAIALSFDGMAAGVGIGLTLISVVEVFILSFITGVAMLKAGGFIGNKIAEKFRMNLSWVSGVILLILAFIRI